MVHTEQCYTANFCSKIWISFNTALSSQPRCGADVVARSLLNAHGWEWQKFSFHRDTTCLVDGVFAEYKCVWVQWIKDVLAYFKSYASLSICKVILNHRLIEWGLVQAVSSENIMMWWMNEEVWSICQTQLPGASRRAEQSRAELVASLMLGSGSGPGPAWSRWQLRGSSAE